MLGPIHGHVLEEHRVERFALDRFDLPEQVGHQQARHGDGERGRHVAHRALARLDPRLAHQRHGIAHGLDAGVGPGPVTVGTQQQEQHGRQAGRCIRGFDVLHRGGDHAAHAAHMMRDQGVSDGERMRQDEQRENGQADQHGFLDSAQVEQNENDHAPHGGGELVGQPRGRQEAEQRVGPAGDGHGDGQHVVNDQRATGDDPRRGRDQFARNHVPAAAGGESLDDL